MSARADGPSARSLRGLDGINFLMADVRDGVGPYLSVFLKGSEHWDAGAIGLAMAASSIAAAICQVPAGLLVDGTRAKRLLVAIAGADRGGGVLAYRVLSAAADGPRRPGHAGGCLRRDPAGDRGDDPWTGRAAPAGFQGQPQRGIQSCRQSAGRRVGRHARQIPRLPLDILSGLRVRGGQRPDRYAHKSAGNRPRSGARRRGPGVTADAVPRAVQAARPDDLPGRRGAVPLRQRGDAADGRAGAGANTSRLGHNRFVGLHHCRPVRHGGGRLVRRSGLGRGRRAQADLLAGTGRPADPRLALLLRIQSDRGGAASSFSTAWQPVFSG